MLYLITWLTDFAIILFVFAGTRLLAERDADPILLGAVGALFFLASAASNASFGRIADRTGRRRVALIGSTLFFVSLAVAAIAGVGGVLFFLSYVGVGVGVGMIYPPIMAWLGHEKLGHAASRTCLLFCVAFNTGMLSAQLSGGWLFEHHGAKAPLVAALGLSMFGFGCLCLFREPRCSPPVEDSSGGSANPGPPNALEIDLARAAVFSRLAWIANFGGMFSMSMVWFLLPKLVVDLGVNAASHGALLAVGRIVVLATYFVMHFFPCWRFRFPFNAAAQVLGVAGLTAFYLAESARGLIVGIVALSTLMGYNYFASLYYSTTSSADETKGKAFGFNEASLGLGAAAGSLLGGVAGADWGVRASFLLAAMLLATLLGLQAIAFRRWMRFINRSEKGALCPAPALYLPEQKKSE